MRQKDFLRDLLAAAPMTAKEVKQADPRADIAPATLRRARQELEISVDKKGGPSQTSWWEWRLLPPGSFGACEDVKTLRRCSSLRVSIFAKFEHLR